MIEVRGLHGFRLVNGRHQLAVGGRPGQVVANRGQPITVVRARHKAGQGHRKRCSDVEGPVGVHGGYG